MNSNGHKPTAGLRVLLSGDAATSVAATLEQEPGLSVIRRNAAGGAPASADVALHVVESSSAPNVAEEARRARELAGAPLILAAYGEPNGIVEAGLAAGAVDVLVMPQPAETLLFAIRKAASAEAAATTGKVVTVFSPKGGSGKTVLATNLAVALAQSGKRTILIDLDVQFGDSALTLAVTPRATIADLASSAGEIDAAKLEAFVSTDARTGLAVLPAPRRPEDADVVGQAELAAVLATARREYEAVVVDTGPLFDAPMLAALDHSDQLLIICNPEVTSLKNVRIGLETIDRLGFERERVSIVANRMGARGALSRSDVELALEAPIAYELPDDSAVPAAVNRALPIVLAKPRSRFSRALAKLAADVFPASETTDQPAKRGILRGRR